MAFSNRDLRIGDLLAKQQRGVTEVYLYLGKYVERTCPFAEGYLYMYITSLSILKNNTDNLNQVELDRFVNNTWDRMYLPNYTGMHSFCKQHSRFDARIGHVDLSSISKEFRYNMKAPFKYIQL